MPAKWLSFAVMIGVSGCTGGPASEASDAPTALAATSPARLAPAVAVGWLKGSLHVHAAPPRRGGTPAARVIRGYRDHDYDFIALTERGRITETGPRATTGDVAVQRDGLIVLAGVELGQDRASLIGATARPPGRIEGRSGRAAIERAQTWGGLVQINPPRRRRGMTAERLTELAERGARLVEIAHHPSAETLWDGALSAGAILWGVASDAAHHPRDLRRARSPAGGGAWIMVRAARAPEAILEALAAGRFYASTGVDLHRAGADGDALVVEVAPTSLGDHEIVFIGDGRVLASHRGRSARHPLAAASYVRAVVHRDDGARAWVQPARR